MIELEKQCVECGHNNKLICDDDTGAGIHSGMVCSSCKTRLYSEAELHCAVASTIENRLGSRTCA